MRWAESGHEVNSFEYGVNLWGLDFTTYTPEGRNFYMHDGHLPVVGETFHSAEMAQTLRGISEHGPDHMITGAWARRFVALGNRLGVENHAGAHDGDAAALDRAVCAPRSPVMRCSASVRRSARAVHTAMVMGILEALDIGRWGPRSAERYLFTAHALRWAERDLGFINDPNYFKVPVSTFLDPTYHAHIARVLLDSLPTVDLTDHVRLTSPDFVLRGMAPLTVAGLPAVTPNQIKQDQPPGSCELSVVDRSGNWVQMMNTLQSGGIPGQVLDGIPMVGSHATFGFASSPLDAKLVPGYRMRSIMGNTLLLKDGQPVFSLGTPGRPHCTVVQVLSNYIFYGMSPVEAVDEPRILPLCEDGVLIMEDRVSRETAQRLYELGTPVRVTHAYEWHMGSFQVCWRNADGTLNSYADPRRCGVAAGLDPPRMR